MDCLSVFNPSRHFISSFIIISFFFLMLFFFWSFSPSLLLLLFLFQLWLQERLQLLHPPTVPLSTYLSRHLRDRWLYRNDMGFDVYMELMGRLKETDIHWVMKWWHISSIVHSCCKDHYLTLVGLWCCSYYSTYRISRQFRERQGAPDDEGLYHTTMFTNRNLGRISEAWPRRSVTKDIIPPKYIYPTTRYKQ